MCVCVCVRHKAAWALKDNYLLVLTSALFLLTGSVVGQKIATHASPITENSAVLISALQVWFKQSLFNFV